MTKPDQNSCQTAEAIIGRKESRTNLEIGTNEGGDGGGNTTDLDRSDSYPEMAPSTEKTDDEYIRSNMLQYPWFHGTMFGEVAEKLLKYDNSYLIRRSILKSSHKFLCLSARVDDKVRHFPLNSNAEGWSCTKLFDQFPKIPNKRYQHIYQLLEAWSLVVNYIVPIPRKTMVLMHSSIQLESQLGRGAFGEVFRAKYTPLGATMPIEVAVKRLIGDAKRSQLQEFCNEASLMALLSSHKNIVGHYGFASLQNPIMLVMELVPGGDLKNHLQHTPAISNKQIVSFALQIASGMRHLASRKVIHRDLAARNCLITKDLVVKISDFGLSVNDVEVTVKNLKKAPIRWLAPETLAKGIFNEKTDVWSYGVLITELMTRCAAVPLFPRDLKEVQKWIKEADHPHRIENGEPRELAEIVDYCCEKCPAARPNFHLVKRRVQSIRLVTIDPEAHSPNPTLEKKRSEDRTNKKSNTDRRASNTTLTRKKSKDGKRKDRTNERKQKGIGGPGGGNTKKTLMSNRRKDKDPKVSVPRGME